MSSSADYWRRREEAQRARNITDEREYAREISRIYESMLDSIEEQINSFYAKYANDEGISMAESKKRAASLDIERYARKAERYVSERDFSAKANEEMRLYNLTMKVNRLELLKANIGLELVSGHDELERYMEETIGDATEDELRRQAGILGKTVINNEKTAHAIVNASFHNATFSDRIWMHQDLLRNDISSLLQVGLIQGKNPRVLARELRRKFDVKKSDAERLMRTELSRARTDAQMREYDENGFGEYKYIACGGADVCEVCKKLDGKVFSVKKIMPGVNAPPMHPNCHCSTGPYIDEKKYYEWLDTYDQHQMSYNDWVEWIDGENERIHIKDTGKNVPGHVNSKLVNTKRYHDKFEKLTKHKAVDEALYNESLKILADNNDTEYEHIVALDAKTGKVLAKNVSATDEKIKHRCGFSSAQRQLLKNSGSRFEVLHNHPNSSIPSRDDIQKLFNRTNQTASTISCHNGDIYRLEKLKDFKAIDALVEELYHKAKVKYLDYDDAKIEYECSMELIHKLEKGGVLKYVKK